VKCFCVAHDSSRIAVGCSDQRIYLYSLHTAQLIRTIAVAHDLAAIAIADKDHFLLASGGHRVTIFSFHNEDQLTNFRPTKQLKRRQTKSKTNISILLAEQNELIPISCLEVSRDGQLAASGCARGLVRVWQLSTHKLQATVNGHMGHVTCVTFSPNNLLVLSGSEDKRVVVWQLADNSSSLIYKVMSDGDNSVRIWTLAGGDSGEEKRQVSHAERITCFALTADSQHVVTGSMDMSLKVWKLDGGKLSQTQVVSGSWDCNLIVWDINTGSDLHLLSGHLGKVTCVKVTGDGTIAVSARVSSDVTVTARPSTGIPDYERLFQDCDSSSGQRTSPVGTEEAYEKTAEKGSVFGHVHLAEEIRTSHLCSYDGSTSMEEISKIQEAKNKDLGSQVSLGPEQAAIAQSQHFDELESLWNKVSPPRRRSNKTLAKQSSLIESRYDSSDEEHTPVEEQ
ncbi:Uncharacterized protein OBRU01_09693, partial [Operophtera brumata]